MPDDHVILDEQLAGAVAKIGSAEGRPAFDHVLMFIPRT